MTRHDIANSMKLAGYVLKQAVNDSRNLAVNKQALQEAVDNYPTDEIIDGLLKDLDICEVG